MRDSARLSPMTQEKLQTTRLKSLCRRHTAIRIFSANGEMASGAHVRDYCGWDRAMSPTVWSHGGRNWVDSGYPAMNVVCNPTRDVSIYAYRVEACSDEIAAKLATAHDRLFRS